MLETDNARFGIVCDLDASKRPPIGGRRGSRRDGESQARPHKTKLDLQGAIMRFFERIRKRKAIGGYVRELPRLLAKDYGRRTQYTPAQVRSTIERYHLNGIYSCYAIAMFSARDAFDQFHEANGEHCSYDAMRGEIAGDYFGGNADFGFSDTIATLSDGNAGHDHGSSHDGGGGHGGH